MKTNKTRRTKSCLWRNIRYAWKQIREKLNQI